MRVENFDDSPVIDKIYSNVNVKYVIFAFVIVEAAKSIFIEWGIQGIYQQTWTRIERIKTRSRLWKQQYWHLQKKNIFHRADGPCSNYYAWRPLHEKCPYWKFFWSVFSHILTRKLRIRTLFTQWTQLLLFH